jgi:hypothetical protein
MNSAVDASRGVWTSRAKNLRCGDCIHALCALGFMLEGTTAIRAVLRRDGHWVYVPRHGPISTAEVDAILVAASVKREDFDRALAGIATFPTLSSA